MSESSSLTDDHSFSISLLVSPFEVFDSVWPDLNGHLFAVYSSQNAFANSPKSQESPNYSNNPIALLD